MLARWLLFPSAMESLTSSLGLRVACGRDPTDMLLVLFFWLLLRPLLRSLRSPRVRKRKPQEEKIQTYSVGAPASRERKAQRDHEEVEPAGTAW